MRRYGVRFVALALCLYLVFWYRDITYQFAGLPAPSSYPFDEMDSVAQSSVRGWTESTIMPSLGYQSWSPADVEQVAQRVTLSPPMIMYIFDPVTMALWDDGNPNPRAALSGGAYVQYLLMFDHTPRIVSNVDYRDGRWQHEGGFEAEDRSDAARLEALRVKLAKRGITDRLDFVVIATSATAIGSSLFAIFDYQGQLMLIPIRTEGSYLTALDRSGDRMYRLSELSPLIRQHAQAVLRERALDRYQNTFRIVVTVGLTILAAGAFVIFRSIRYHMAR